MKIRVLVAAAAVPLLSHSHHLRLNEDELAELVRLADPDQDGNVSVHPCQLKRMNTCG